MCQSINCPPDRFCLLKTDSMLYATNQSIQFSKCSMCFVLPFFRKRWLGRNNFNLLQSQKYFDSQLSIYVFIIANMSVFFSEETCSNSFKNVFNLKIVVTCFWNVNSIRFRVCVYVFLCTFFRIELERMWHDQSSIFILRFLSKFFDYWIL